MAEIKDITYPNALASNGKIVNVNDPDFQDRTLTFTCLGCGEPMSAVHREKGQSHFRHKNSNPNCNPQTYLHRLAKKEYKRMFDSGEPFMVRYKSERLCQYYDICVFREEGDECAKPGIDKIDLHSIYDTCQEEVGYKGFIADLLLTSSKEPERTPMFLEIAVTHKCDEEKINSGIPIIEIDVQEESDIHLPLSETASGNTKPVMLYNFDRKVKGKAIYDTRRITRSTILQGYNRTISWRKDEGTCLQMMGMPSRQFFYEIFLKKDVADSLGDTELQKLTYAGLPSRGIIPDFCIFCNKCRTKDKETGKLGEFFCKTAPKALLKSLNCPGFEFEKESIKEIFEQHKDIEYLSRGIQKKK